MRARALIAGLGPNPAPDKIALANLTGRLMIHLQNVSDQLYRQGELTVDREPKLLLGKIVELSRIIRENLFALRGDSDADAGDPFGALSS